MEAFRDFRRDIDATLQRILVAATTAKDTTIGSSDTSEVCSLDECSLHSVGSRFQNLSASKMKDFFSGSVQYSIPINLLNNDQIVDIVDDDSMKEKLGNGDFSITVNGVPSIGPLCLERLEIESVDIENDWILDNPGKLDENRKNILRGNSKYLELLHRTSRFIADADLTISIDEIGILAQRSVGIAATVGKDECKTIAKIGLQKLLGVDRGNRFAIRHVNTEKNEVHCRIGELDWKTGFSGLGIRTAVQHRFEIYQTTNDEDIKSIINADCSINQCFSLYDDANIYFECGDYAENKIPTQATVDKGNGFLVVILKSVDYSESKTPDIKTSLSSVVANLPSNDDESNSFDPQEQSIGVDETFHLFNLYANQVESKIISIQKIFPTERVTSISTSLRHSLLLTSFGYVYSCGDSSDGQLGHGSLSGCRAFRVIEWFLQRNIAIVDISAGSDKVRSHSAAVSKEGELYTWGYSALCGHSEHEYSLGLPEPSQTSNKSSIVFPTRVESFENEKILRVSCGGSFTLAITQYWEAYEEKRTLWSWGCISNGRLGIGRFEISRRSYQKSPTRLVSLDGYFIVDVSSGSSHALALDRDGKVFAWGNNEAGQCSFDFNKFGENVLPQQMNRSIWDDVYVPHQVMVPIPAVSVAAGSHSSAVIDVEGRLWTWGRNSKPCLHQRTSCHVHSILSGFMRLPRYATPRIATPLKHVMIKKVCLGDRSGLAITNDGQIYCWDNVDSATLPSLPSPNKFPSLVGKRIIDADIAGNHIIVQGEPSVKENIGSKLFQQINRHEKLSIQNGGDLSVPTFFDCAVIVGKHRLCCHKAILKCRCPVFEKIISAHKSSLLEILITDANFHTVAAMLHFIYTGTLKSNHVTTPRATRTLMAAAKSYGLDRLAQICHDILTIEKFEVRDVNEASASTLVTDFAKMINDPDTADVRILISSENATKIVYGHRCVFLTRSPILFRQINNSIGGGLATIHIAGSYEVILRLLLFVYTGMLTAEHNEQLMEDVEIASTYGVLDMVRQCECLFSVSVENSFELLEFSLRYGLERLKQATLLELAKDRKAISEIMTKLVSLDSGILSELFDMIKEDQGVFAIIPRERVVAAHDHIDQTRIRILNYRERYLQDDIMKGITFSTVIGLIVTVICAVAFIRIFQPGHSFVVGVNLAIFLLMIFHFL